MKLTIPTWLAFLFLGIASFAPVVSLRAGWWMPYYGALLVCWVLTSIAAIRGVARKERRARRRLAHALRRLGAANGEAAEMNADTGRHTPRGERLIVVAHDAGSLYEHIRRDRYGDETVKVIRDRRSTDRRLRMEAHTPDRRRDERRTHNINPLLLTQGWAEITLPEH